MKNDRFVTHMLSAVLPCTVLSLARWFLSLKDCTSDFVLSGWTPLDGWMGNCQRGRSGWGWDSGVWNAVGKVDREGGR